MASPKVSTRIFSNHYAIVLLDLPEGFPGHLDDEDVAILRRQYEGEDIDEDDDVEGFDLGDLDEDEEDIDEDDGLDLDDLDLDLIRDPTGQGGQQGDGLAAARCVLDQSATPSTPASRSRRTRARSSL